MGEFLQISGHGVLDKVIGGPSGFGGELLQTRLGLWPKVHFHKR